MNDTRIKNRPLKLTRKQREILVGLILGDGHLETQTSGKTYRLKIEHSIKQKDYVLWLYDELKNLVPGKIYEKKRDTRHFVGFQTYSSPSFCFYARQFYPNGKKVIPKLIEKMLTPRALAIWFMDDGSRKSKRHKTYNIHTVGYAKKDLERMSEALKKRLDIRSSLHSQKKYYWRMYIPSSSAQKLKDIVEPYAKMIPSMRNKLG